MDLMALLALPPTFSIRPRPLFVRTFVMPCPQACLDAAAAMSDARTTALRESLLAEVERRVDALGTTLAERIDAAAARRTAQLAGEARLVEERADARAAAFEGRLSSVLAELHAATDARADALLAQVRADVEGAAAVAAASAREESRRQAAAACAAAAMREEVWGARAMGL